MNNNYPKLEKIDNIKVKRSSTKINWKDFVNSLSTVAAETALTGIPLFSTIKLFMSIGKKLDKSQLLYELIFNSLIHSILYNEFKSKNLNKEKKFWKNIYNKFNLKVKDKTINEINLNLIINEQLSQINFIYKICEEFKVGIEIYHIYFYREINNTLYFNFIGNQYKLEKQLEMFNSPKIETSTSNRNSEYELIEISKERKLNLENKKNQDKTKLKFLKEETEEYKKLLIKKKEIKGNLKEIKAEKDEIDIKISHKEEELKGISSENEKFYDNLIQKYQKNEEISIILYLNSIKKEIENEDKSD